MLSVPPLSGPSRHAIPTSDVLRTASSSDPESLYERFYSRSQPPLLPNNSSIPTQARVSKFSSASQFWRCDHVGPLIGQKYLDTYLWTMKALFEPRKNKNRIYCEGTRSRHNLEDRLYA